MLLYTSLQIPLPTYNRDDVKTEPIRGETHIDATLIMDWEEIAILPIPPTGPTRIVGMPEIDTDEADLRLHRKKHKFERRG